MAIVLTHGQKKALEYILSGRNVFLTGPGGTGKTQLIKQFMTNCKNKIQKHPHTSEVGVTSMTGVSAILIGGCTLHSYTGIGLGNAPINILIQRIKKNPKARDRWRNTRTLIIDEVSMLDPELFDNLNTIAKAVRGNTRPFGGIQLILVGDMLQLPVVNKPAFCFESKTWSEAAIETVELTEIVRQKDTQFQECLNKIRYGVVDQPTKDLIQTRVGVELDTSLGIKPTKIFPLNRDVDYINQLELDSLQTQMFTYNMDISIKNANALTQIQTFKKHFPGADQLRLAVGCQVMLLHNLSVELGLANGSRGVVTEFISGMPVVRFLNGVETSITRHEWTIEEHGKPIATLSQIPLKLAWAVSVHKQQGATLDYAVIDMTDIFEYGMGYVALSRVKNLEGLSIVDIAWNKIKAHPKALDFYNKLNV